MTQVGGDSQNTMPVAIQAGLQARQIAKATIDPAAKFTMDGFKQSFSNPGAILQSAKGNLPVAEALQQQSFIARMAAKIPFVRTFLGPDFIVNEAIGKLGKEALNGASQVSVTRAVLEGGDDVAAIAQKLKQLNLSDDAIKAVTESVGKKIAAQGGRAVATEVATTAGGQVAKTVATTMVDDLAREAAKAGLRKGFKDVTETMIREAMSGAEPAKALYKLGFTKRFSEGVVKRMGTSVTEVAAKTAVTEVATTAAATTAKETTKTGLKGWANKILGGVKGNFVVAGVFSLASNAIQLAKGEIGVKQFLGLTVVDTAAYGAIGWGSAAAGAAIGSVVPGIGTAVGFVVGLGLGFLGGSVYEKFVRNPLKNLLGGTPAGGADPSQYDPGAYNQQAPGANTQYQPLPPTANSQMDYEQAMREIERLASNGR